MRRRYLFFCFTFWIVAFLLGLFLQRPIDHEKATKNVQKKIYKLSEDIDKNLSKIYQSYTQDSESLYKIDLKYKENRPIIYSVSTNDTLRFWSSSKIPLENNYYKNNHRCVQFLENGWYLYISQKHGDTICSAHLLLEQLYSYENKYLENQPASFLQNLNVKEVTFIQNENAIFGSDKSYLFSLSYISDRQLSNWALYAIFAIYLIGYIFLILFLWEWFYHFRKQFGIWIFILFAIKVLLIRLFIFYLEIPHILYTKELFQAFQYAGGAIAPSLGDFIVNAFTVIIPAFIIFRHLPTLYRVVKIDPFWQKTASILFAFLGTSALILAASSLDSLVKNSSLQIDLTDIFSMQPESWLGLLAVAIYFCAATLFTITTFYLALKKMRLYWIILVTICTTLLYNHIFDISIFSGTFFIAIIFQWVLLWMINRRSKDSFPHFVQILVLLFFLSLFSTTILQYSLDKKEREIRRIVAFELAGEERDPVAEYLFSNLKNGIQNDISVMGYAAKYSQQNRDWYDKLRNHIKDYFLTGYWKNFNTEITICDSLDILYESGKEQSNNCQEFFKNMIEEYGSPSGSEDLFLLRYTPAEFGYLASFPLSAHGSGPMCYIEWVRKYAEQGLGYPELLVDEGFKQVSNLNRYSYAKYYNGEIVTNTGNYAYKSSIGSYRNIGNRDEFFNKNGFSHFLQENSDGVAIIISKEQHSFLNSIAPFAYLFIFYSFTLLLCWIFCWLASLVTFSLHRLDFRIQIFMVITLLFVFLVIGFSVIRDFKKLGEKKDITWLKEKAHSVLVEFGNKTDLFDDITPEKVDHLSFLSDKYSSIFFTDINLFKPSGELITSSRLQVFSENLIGSHINPRAYYALSYQQKSIFVHTEHIGNLAFLSAYIPLKDSYGKVIAYINLPYFVRIGEQKAEIAQFLTSFSNVYILLLVLVLLVSITLSNYITKPMQILRSRLAEFRLGKKNDKIEWKRNDELGSLVEEYNSLIDKLDESVRLLAKSEREGAWGNMARQIAHEVKNSLTPMKLSIQHLQRAWSDNSADFEERLQKTTETLINQINVLDSVAGGFSDFARLPQAERKNVDICAVIQHSMVIFSEYGVAIELHNCDKTEHSVFADKQLLLRVFNNLIKNAIQSIRKPDDGKIDIFIDPWEENRVCVSVKDNGSGVPENVAEQIFNTDFTTKKGGMGLGLAMVKAIIEDNGGSVWVESEKNIGSVFYFTLPRSL